MGSTDRWLGDKMEYMKCNLTLVLVLVLTLTLILIRTLIGGEGARWNTRSAGLL